MTSINWMPVRQLYVISLPEDRFLSNPSGLTPGIYTLRVNHTAGGGHLLTYGSKYRFPRGVTPTLSTVTGARDFLKFLFDGVYMNYLSSSLDLMVPLPAPTSVVATVDIVGRIDLTWVDTTSDETAYEIYRSDDPLGFFEPLVTVAAGVTLYQDPDVVSDVPYFYKVRALRDTDRGVFGFAESGGVAPAA